MPMDLPPFVCKGQVEVPSTATSAQASPEWAQIGNGGLAPQAVARWSLRGRRPFAAEICKVYVYRRANSVTNFVMASYGNLNRDCAVDFEGPFNACINDESSKK